MNSRKHSLAALLSLCVAFCVATTTAGAQTFQPANTTAVKVVAGSTSTWVDGPITAQYRGLEMYNPATGGFNAPFAFSPARFGAGGGNAAKADMLWLWDYSNYIYGYDVRTLKPTCCFFVPNVQSIVVGLGYSDNCHPYEVWTLSSQSSTTPAQRFNFCTVAFEAIGNSLNLRQIATGGGEVWAVSTSNGAFRFNPATLQFTPIIGTVTQIAVGVDGVWGLNPSGNLLEFNPVLQQFASISSSLITIAAGGNGVWGLNSQHQIYRYEASTRTLKLVGSGLATISSGTGGGVWGTDSATNVYALVTP